MRVKDPIAAIAGIVNKTPVAYTSKRSSAFAQQMNRVSNDPAAQMAAMGGTGTLFGIVTKIGDAVSSVDWHLHRIAQRRSKTTKCEVCEEPGVSYVEMHPALEVLKNPNNFFTQQRLMRSVEQHYDLVGEGYFVVPRVAGRPVEMWPVRPDRIAPNRHATEFMTGYTYYGPDGEKIPLRNDEVVSLIQPHPLDPYRGMGAVQAVLTQIHSLEYSAEWNRTFFENSAEPGGVIEVPGEMMDDDEFDEYQARWSESHRGVSNAHRVALIEKGGVWKQNAFSQRDMQFSELRAVSREEIREAFTIHKHMLGISDDVNLANSKGALEDFARYISVPRLDTWKDAFNKFFLPMFGPDMSKQYAFAYTNPVPEDRDASNKERESKANAYQKLILAGVHPDDAALVAGLPVMRHVGVPNVHPNTPEGPPAKPAA